MDPASTGPASASNRLRVVLDSSVLLGSLRQYMAAAIHRGYVAGYWSTWIVAELARKRTEWVARRAVKDGCDVAELVRRLDASRSRVNALIAELSLDMHSVDYRDAPEVDLSWLAERDPDDVPVMRTALAAGAAILVADDRRAYPVGQSRNGVQIMSSTAFLEWLYRTYPTAEADIRAYLGE